MRKRYGVYVLLTLFSLAVVVLLSGTVHAQTETSDSSPSMRRFLITQINLGNNDVFDQTSNVPKEYVAITNVGNTVQEPSGLTLEYLKTAEGINSDDVCDRFPWPADALGSDYATSIVGDVEPLEPGATLYVDFALVNARGGSLRLTEMHDSAMLYHDLVGWSRADSAASCFRQQPVEVGTDLIATRLQHFNYSFQDTEHNLRDFRAEFGPLVDACANLDDLQRSVPGGMEVNDLGECIETVVDIPSQCDAVRLNEVLPNPAGSDSGNEFIELFNTSDEVVELGGCVLQVDDDDELPLDDYSLGSRQYLTFSDDELGFTLTNSSGGTVYLLSATDEVDMVVYPENLDDNQSYARFGSVDQPQWRATYSATPAAENVFTEYLPCQSGEFRNPDTNRCNSVVVQVDDELSGCGPGRYRSPETNRCRNLETAASNNLVPCAANQYRNPATNRCRLVATQTSSLQPCAADQYRNPATNRCKKVESANQLEPCGEGRERNHETNRCRNVASVASVTTGPAQTTNNTEPDAPQPSSINVPLVAVAGLAAVGYGLYEYRQDIRAWIWRIRQRFSS